MVVIYESDDNGCRDSGTEKLELSREDREFVGFHENLCILLFYVGMHGIYRARRKILKRKEVANLATLVATGRGKKEEGEY